MKNTTLLPSLVLAGALTTTAGAAVLHARPALAQVQNEPSGGGGMMHDMHGGMMSGPGGGDMGGMTPMTQDGRGGRMMGGGGMPFEHIEGRLAFLKAELKITAAQEPQWTAFADAVRSVGRSMREMHEQMMQGGHGGGMEHGGPQGAAATAPGRLDHDERMLAARLEALRIVKSTFDPLYALLSDEQKKMADELMIGPMGVV